VGGVGLSRLGRYWLFFVIVAVGLVLSWGQVGRKTHQVLTEAPTTLLTTEANCRPGLAPCAAMGNSRAMVLGPAGNGLRVVTKGFDPASLLAARATWFDRANDVVGQSTLSTDATEWRIRSLPGDARRMRIEIDSNDGTVVAEFPLD
jgi:hypothetical protein